MGSINNEPLVYFEEFDGDEVEIEEDDLEVEEEDDDEEYFEEEDFEDEE